MENVGKESESASSRSALDNRDKSDANFARSADIAASVSNSNIAKDDFEEIARLTTQKKAETSQLQLSDSLFDEDVDIKEEVSKKQEQVDIDKVIDSLLGDEEEQSEK